MNGLPLIYLREVHLPVFVSSGSICELVSKILIHSFHVDAELFGHHTFETL